MAWIARLHQIKRYSSPRRIRATGPRSRSSDSTDAQVAVLLSVVRGRSRSGYSNPQMTEASSDFTTSASILSSTAPKQPERLRTAGGKGTAALWVGCCESASPSRRIISSSSDTASAGQGRTAAASTPWRYGPCHQASPSDASRLTQGFDNSVLNQPAPFKIH